MNHPDDLRIETEAGEVVDSLDIHINEVMRIIDNLPDDELATSHCLQYIDNYGDTVFNNLQKHAASKSTAKSRGNRNSRL